jgi:hypothetical protein
MKSKDILIIGGLIALAGAAYYGLKNLNLSNLFGGLGGGILQAGGAEPETLQETGLTGGVGNIVYNLVMPDLRQRVKQRHLTHQMRKGGYVHHGKAVSEVVSEDIHRVGLAGVFTPFLQAWTIGAGLGAIKQRGEYLKTLPAWERKREEIIESRKRLKFQFGTHEGRIATAFMPPLVSIPLAISDVSRAKQKLPKPPIKAPQKKMKPLHAAALATAPIPPSERLRLAREAFLRG